MKNIGIYVDCEYKMGGMFQYCKSVLTALASLDKEKYCINVIYTKRSWEEYLSKDKFQLIYLPHNIYWKRFYKLGLSFGLFTFIKKLACIFDKSVRTINNTDYDVMIFPAQDIIAPFVKSNILGTIHDLMHKYESRFPESGSFLRYKCREVYFKNLSLAANQLLVDSIVGKQHVMESYSIVASKINVLPYIAPDYVFTYKISEQQRVEFNEKYKLPKKYLFYPAQLWKHKNHSNLLKAIALLKDEIPDVFIVLSGGRKNNYQNILYLIDSLGIKNKVFLIGYVSEVEIICLYNSASALVMPTFYGPTNIPPLEAFELGCPVAVSNVYGMAEQVGDAALLFNPNSVKEIAEAVKSIWCDSKLRDDLKRKGYLKARKWNQTKFNSAFEEILVKAGQFR